MGYAFGMGWFGVGAWWLAPTVHQFGGLPWWLAAAVVLLVGAVLACFPALWIWAARKLADKSQQPYALFLLLPACAMLMEWLRGHLLTGLPWTALGNLLLDTPAVGWLSVLGVYGAAAIVVLLAISLAALCLKEQRRFAYVGLITCALLLLLTPNIQTPNGEKGRVALIQPNIAQDQKWDANFLSSTMNDLVSLSASSADKVDLIIWPEAAVPLYLKRSPSWDAWLRQQMQTWHTPVLFGGLKYFPEDKTSQNGLYLFDEHQATRSFVGKHHLVPFGEYVPTWLPWLHKIVPDIGDFRGAHDSGVLPYQQTIFGSLICYESIFPEEARARVRAGATLLILVTNDAWYGHTPAGWQHLQAAQARAVETGRYLLRAGNTGISAIISPAGKITKTTEWWQKTALIGSYQNSTRTTFYHRWGDLTGLIIAALTIIWAVFGTVRSGRSKEVVGNE